MKRKRLTESDYIQGQQIRAVAIAQANMGHPEKVPTLHEAAENAAFIRKQERKRHKSLSRS